MFLAGRNTTCLFSPDATKDIIQVQVQVIREDES